MLALLLVVGCKDVMYETAVPVEEVQVAPQRAIIDLAPREVRGPLQQPGTGKVVKVGLLLPLTGGNADIGRAMQDAATVALFDKYANLSPAQASIRVELLPKDTGDTPAQARVAMQSALDEGAELIIGPLFADATQAAAPLAAERGISVISLSNNRGAAGSGIYAFGFSPQEQTIRVVRFALASGKLRVAALVPDAPLGEAVLAAAREATESVGTKLAAEVRYAPQGVGIEAALSQLLPPGGPPNFDALLLPEGGPALATILRALASRGVSLPQVQLLSTGMWDDANLIRRVNLEGAWLASSPPQATALFEQRFAATYKYVPPRIASLSYDAVALAVTLATSGRPFVPVALNNSAGFAGPANGVFRLKPDGTVERALAVLQVQGSGFVVIDPAPQGFTSQAVLQ